MLDSDVISKMADIAHPSYDANKTQVQLARDCLAGSHAIKTSNLIDVYMPDPSDVKPTDPSAAAAHAKRLTRYRNAAEYDNVPARTLASYLGSMESKREDFEAVAEVSDLEYIIDNADGAGSSIMELVKQTQSELLALKYCGWLATFSAEGYQDESGNAVQLSQGEREALGHKAYIKLYTREAIKDIDYQTIGGVTRLSYVKLEEVTSYVNPETLEREQEARQLLLHLDENGQYYQRAIIRTLKNGGEYEHVITDAVYPVANGGRFNEIPFILVCEQKAAAHDLPSDFGVMHPIYLKSLARLRLSAQLHNSLHMLGEPMVNTTGWTQTAFESFKEMNSDGLTIGVNNINFLPDDVQLNVVSWNAGDSAIFAALEKNEKELKALGGRFNTEDAQNEAVGTAQIRSAEELAALKNTQSAIESALMQVLPWLHRFVSMSETPEMVITLTRKFNEVTISEARILATNTLVKDANLPIDEAIKIWHKGGFLVSSPEDVAAQLSGAID